MLGSNSEFIKLSSCRLFGAHEKSSPSLGDRTRRLLQESPGLRELGKSFDGSRQAPVKMLQPVGYMGQMKPPGIGPQVLVLVSIYHGAILGTYF